MFKSNTFFKKFNLKTYYLSLIIAVALSCLLTNCAKETIPTLRKPRLFITLKDDAGKSIAGATVKLYKTNIDSSLIKISDTAGVVIFADLDVANYSWLAQKGCYTNRISQTTLSRNMVPDVVLYGYSVMAENGALKIINNAPEAYKVSDSLMKITVKKDTPYLAFRRIRSYLLHVEKLSTPGIIKDTLVKIRCNDTTTLRLPF
jgi:hypothetical protein